MKTKEVKAGEDGCLAVGPERKRERNLNVSGRGTL